MSLKHFPDLLDRYADAHGDEAELPSWMQVAAAMVAVSEELGGYTGADTLTLRSLRRRERQAQDEDDQHQAVFDRIAFASIVDFVRARLTRRGGYASGGQGTVYDPEMIADFLSDENPSVMPAHVRAAIRGDTALE